MALRRLALASVLVSTILADQPKGDLEAELSTMKMPALIKRAEALGISEGSLDEAGENDDHGHAAICRLILNTPRHSGRGRPARFYLARFPCTRAGRRAQRRGCHYVRHARLAPGGTRGVVPRGIGDVCKRSG